MIKRKTQVKIEWKISIGKYKINRLDITKMNTQQEGKTHEKKNEDCFELYSNNIRKNIDELVI